MVKKTGSVVGAMLLAAVAGAARILETLAEAARVAIDRDLDVDAMACGIRSRR